MVESAKRCPEQAPNERTRIRRVDTNCPGCESENVDSFCEISAIPVDVGKSEQSEEAARNANRGDIQLCYCSGCGLVYNAKFDPTKIGFEPGYEVALHHSETFRNFIETLASRLLDKYSMHGRKVLDIGCGGGKSVELLNRDISDWTITFVDTGTNACIGERLRAVRPHLENEEVFLANYTDGLSDVHLPGLIDFHQRNDAIASFLSVRPSQSFHATQTDRDGAVKSICEIDQTDSWMNGGFFVFSQQLFDYLGEGEELVHEPFNRLIAERKLYSLKHEGFWSCMDTYKEKQHLDELYSQGQPPWVLWDQAESTQAQFVAPSQA